MAKQKAKKLMGEHWESTGYPKVYQLSRRVETVAHELAERRSYDWAPLKRHVEELYAIAGELKILDSKMVRRTQRASSLGHSSV